MKTPAEPTPPPSLHFFTGDSPFFWVRACTTQSLAAKHAGLILTSEFQRIYPEGGAIPLFNRFCTDKPHKRILDFCRAEEIPFLVDIDDLFWDLPDYSSDRARHDDACRSEVDAMCRDSWGLIASTPYLRQRLQERYAGKTVFLVENSDPAWYAPAGSALIANTDALKLAKADTLWFADVVFSLWDSGVGIQLIGENDALTSSWLEPHLHSLPRMSYREYLAHLKSGQFRLGLMPVGQSSYADAKSSIKLIEFMGSGIPVIASDTAPHRQFLLDHPSLAVTLVDNTESAWRRAVESFLGAMTPEQIQTGKRTNQMLHAVRTRQFNQWREVFQSLPADPAIVRKTQRLHRSCRRQQRLDLLALYLAPLLAMFRLRKST